MPILKFKDGCTLSRYAGSYIMAGGRTGRHELSVEHTDKERLEAHWEGYVAANPLLKYKVHYVRENQHREYNAKGEKVARKRRTHKTVMACNPADAVAHAKGYSRRFYPQCYFTLVGVEEVSK